MRLRLRLSLPCCLFCAALVSPSPAGGQVADFQETLRAPLDSKLSRYRPVGRLSGRIRSASADTMLGVMKRWVADFTRIYPDVSIAVESKEALTMIMPALTAETIDLAPMAREALPSEEEAYRRKFGHAPLAIEVTGGTYRTPGKTPALMFFVNKANPLDRLTLAQLDAILSTTRKRGYKDDVRTWGQLGATGEWANAPIHIYGVERPNGIPHFIQLRVMQGGEFKEGLREVPASGPVYFYDRIVQAVAGDPYGIGYGAAVNEKPNTKRVALAAKEGGPYYRGSFEEVVSGKYPLARVTYMYLNPPSTARLDPTIVEFLKFVLSRQGQQEVAQEGVLLPLRADQAARETAKLK